MQEFQFFKPQKNISNEDLLQGKILYCKANQLVNNGAREQSPEVISLLKRAATKHHNFAAIRTLNRFHCEKLHKGEKIDPQECFSLLFQTQEIHGTPIYLMIALTCVFYTKFDTAYYDYALQYLKLAEKSEGNDQNEIYNAYEGKGIAKSNPWGIDNIKALTENLLKHYQR